MMGAHTALPLVRAPIPSSFLNLSTLLALLTCPFFFALFAVAADPAAEAVAEAAANTAVLLKFKASLTNTNLLGSWTVGSTPCNGHHSNWEGVLCFSGMINGLKLEEKGLAGKVDVDALVDLLQLRTISLQKNKFEGPIPDFRKLGKLRSLYLSGNQFSGKIPDEAFEGMGSLKKLLLSNNNFTGTLPSSLARLPKLIDLEVNENQFEGPISEFEKRNWRLLNLTNNQLEGPVPASLMSLNPEWFSGNEGLCGKPLDKECNFPTPTEPTSTPSAPGAESPPSSDGNESSPVKVLLIVIACLVALLALFAVLAIYRRSSETPQLGKAGSYKSGGGVAAGAVAVGASSRSSGSSCSSVSQSTKQMDKGYSGEIKRGSLSKKAEPTVKLSFVRDDRMKFDLQDLLRASAEVLGSGNFGSSYKAVLMDGQAVVVKRFKQMNNVSREEFHEHMRRLGRLEHPNLLPLVAYYYRKEEKLLVFDFVHNGSLASHLHGNHTAERPGLNWPTRLKIVKGVAKGLSYLHNELPSLIVSHGHLKSSNVLLNKAFEPLLMDYTLVPVVNLEHAQQILVAYKSPEYAHTGRTTKKTDVWSLGILILEILTGKFPSIYLGNGVNNSTDLATWVNNVVKEETVEVFDKEMGYTMNDEDEMMKLLKIGVACCEDDVVKRLDLKDAVEKIEEVKSTEEFVVLDV